MQVIRELSGRKGLRLGVVGGTFDPVHMGHLIAAEEARRCLGLTDVVFVPTGIAPHKEREATPAEVRYLMVSLAVLAHPAFWVSRMEIDRGGVDYTVDTMERLREVLGAEVPLYFIAGADSVMDLLEWKDPERLLELCVVVGMSRPGYGSEQLEQVLARLPDPERVHMLDMPPIGISSSEIRARVSRGEGCRFLVPEPVERVIAKMDLYRGGR